MSINDPTASQTRFRAPRFRVLSNGNLLPGVESATVESNSYYRSDSFSLTCAASYGPPGWWDVEPPWVVDLQMSLDDGATGLSMIIGEVDKVSMSQHTGTLTLEGRDLSARFIEAKTQEAFVNQTSSEVAQKLAGRRGLGALITPTTTLTGRYYEDDHVSGTFNQFGRSMTEWDLLVFLAQREDFDVFVQGQILHFQPRTAPNADPFVIQWSSENQQTIPRLNTITLRMQRSLTLAKDVEVWVRSWSTQQGRSFTKKARSSGTKPASASGGKTGKSDTQRYTFVRPNLTETQAQDLANRIESEISIRERVVDVDMPGDVTLTPRNMVRLQGTKSTFDQTYFIDHITRSISFSEGFRQSLRLKSSSPRSQVQA